MYVGAYLLQHVYGEQTTLSGSWFTPSSMPTLRIELGQVSLPAELSLLLSLFLSLEKDLPYVFIIHFCLRLFSQFKCE